MKKSILNTAAYQFIHLNELSALREKFIKLGHELELVGTILLAEEGINLMFSGQPGSVKTMQDSLDALFGPLVYKDSWSEKPTFRRWLVKIKSEIIPMGHPDIETVNHTAPSLPPEKLKDWLDQGKDIILLDTRNDYEVRTGKITNAVDLDLKDFRSFFEKIHQLDSIKEKTIVAYCTGGIRCEKATAYMRQNGFSDVYQLENGILGYFEKCAGAHYEDECFVFDARASVDCDLNETQTVICFACQNPLTLLEQQSSDYKIGVSCSYCVSQVSSEVNESCRSVK